MNRTRITIEEWADSDRVGFYTIKVEGQSESETDLFFEEYDADDSVYINDIDTIYARIEKIGENGAFERYFRYAGKVSDNVSELPSNEDKAALRLYCIRLSENIVIIGNGGPKNVEKYQEDPYLNSCVEILQKIDGIIRSRIGKEEISEYNGKLFGNLTFYI